MAIKTRYFSSCWSAVAYSFFKLIVDQFDNLIIWVPEKVTFFTFCVGQSALH